jgi:hypothetical protein
MRRLTILFLRKEDALNLVVLPIIKRVSWIWNLFDSACLPYAFWKATKLTSIYLLLHLQCSEYKRRQRLRKERRKSQGSAVSKQSPPPEKVCLCWYPIWKTSITLTFPNNDFFLDYCNRKFYLQLIGMK